MERGAESGSPQLGVILCLVDALAVKNGTWEGKSMLGRF